MITEKLNHLAMLEIEKAEKLSSIGQNDEAILLMENIDHFSQEAKIKYPILKQKIHSGSRKSAEVWILQEVIRKVESSSC